MIWLLTGRWHVPVLNPSAPMVEAMFAIEDGASEGFSVDELESIWLGLNEQVESFSDPSRESPC